MALAQAPTPKASPKGLTDKVVFVHADPSVGVRSLRTITDVDLKSGDVVGSHGGPELDATSSSSHIKDEIELMNPDGSSITPLRVFGSDPMLSPDGTKIVYCSGKDTLYWQIYVVDTAGKSPKRLTDVNSGDACGPAWSPDGKKIAYYVFANTHPSRNPAIWIMDADGSNQKRIAEHGMDPTWSPDGRQIAFSSRHDGVFQIYSMNADGTNIRQLTKTNAENSNPAWAPDGKSIAYISATSDDRRGLSVMNPDGSQPQGLVHSKHQDFCFPAWSNDGQFILFTSLNRLGTQSIVAGEDKPRCEQWTGEYQIFSVDNDLKVKQVTGAKVMGMRPSYGRVASAP